MATALNPDLALFFAAVEPVKDASKNGWCTGRGFIMRRLGPSFPTNQTTSLSVIVALDQVKGFPTGTLAEDVACSSLMLGLGQCGSVADFLIDGRSRLADCICERKAAMRYSPGITSWSLETYVYRSLSERALVDQVFF